MDPLSGSPWSAPGTVAGFADSPPNQTLMSFAARERERGARRAVDIGCGAGRNLVPLAREGWSIIGVDLSRPMIESAAERVVGEGLGQTARLALAPMHALPVADRSADLIIAHGIWNLAKSGDEFRAAVGEAARIARAGAALFVFTFSRHTLPPDARPVDGESFVFTGFSGSPQIFLTHEELVAELGAVHFIPDRGVPLTEHNLPRNGALRSPTVPVIYEAAFRLAGGGR
jgi:SAM-dependent methyltransferase